MRYGVWGIGNCSHALQAGSNRQYGPWVMGGRGVCVNRSWVITEYLPNTITVATLNVNNVSPFSNSFISIKCALWTRETGTWTIAGG
jgi:hypothetical protein